MLATMDDPSLGGLPRQLGKYTLVERLATGGMAELFLAIQRSLGGFEKLIVIKRILPTRTEDPLFTEMLLHEARIAATLSHPNLVQVFDVGKVDGAYFIAMEHLHGEDLRAVVRQLKSRSVSEFPLEHALSIAAGVCAGLAYAHDKRDFHGEPLDIVHRDISPQNVVVTFSGDVKVVDFGIAKSTANMVDETGAGRLKGKVPYMSPEQARGEPIDRRSDIFAVGIILYELTTGRRLFKATSEYETFKLICERDVPRPSSVRSDYPAALEAIVMRALAKNREDRWQSAREMQRAVEEFVRQGRIPANRSGLADFVRSLFGEKVLRHEDALAQGRRLDITRTAPPEQAIASARVPSFGPTAARTVTDAGSATRSSRAGILAGTLGVLAALGMAAELAFSQVGARTRDAVVHTPPPPTEPRAPRPDHGVIAVASSPAGAAIFVNGELSAATTPATFGHVAIGIPYVVTLIASGCDAASRTLTLTNDNPSGAISAVLEPCALGKAAKRRD